MKAWIHAFLANWVIADPNYIELTCLKSYKNYQAQKQAGLNYVYLFGGRMRVAKETPTGAAIGVMILVLGVLFYVFDAHWTWTHVSPAIPFVFTYLWLLTLAMFAKAATSDPGVLPRNVHMPFDLRLATHDAPLEYFSAISLPYHSEKYQGVAVKYCPTCHIWRPPRASHCGVCNVCVANHDHHCTYINNCVGLRNYKYFLWFILTATLTCLLVIAVSFVQLLHYRTVESDIDSFRRSLSQFPGTFVLLILTFLAMAYPCLILLVHIVLTAQNLTTREYLNNVRSDPNWTNVFNTHNVMKNYYINWIGRARGVSLIRQRDVWRREDVRLQHVAPLK